MRELDRIVAAMREARSAGQPSCLATILRTEGSSFRRPGARLWIGGSRRVGTISGGCLEEDLAARAPSLLERGAPIVVAYDTGTDGDVLWGTSSGCGGRLEILLEPVGDELVEDLEWIRARQAERRDAVLLTRWASGSVMRTRVEESAQAAEEPVAEALASRRTVTAKLEDGIILAEVFRPPIAVTIFGGGADATATAGLAARLGWDVRAHGSLPADRIPEAARSVPEDDRSAALVMTHNFHRDLEIVSILLPKPLGYLGILGPRRRTLELLGPLGASSTALHAPPGLDIGGETPEEIALSLTAEIQGVMARRGGGPLRERRGPIHDRVGTIDSTTLVES